MNEINVSTIKTRVNFPPFKDNPDPREMEVDGLMVSELFDEQPDITFKLSYIMKDGWAVDYPFGQVGMLQQTIQIWGIRWLRQSTYVPWL